jgi:hypothetical protein
MHRPRRPSHGAASASAVCGRDGFKENSSGIQQLFDEMF